MDEAQFHEYSENLARLELHREQRQDRLRELDSREKLQDQLVSQVTTCTGLHFDDTRQWLKAIDRIGAHTEDGANVISIVLRTTSSSLQNELRDFSPARQDA